MVEMIDWAVGDAPLAGAAFSGAGLAAAIGNFDGVHRGHQTVVAAAVAAAPLLRSTPAAAKYDKVSCNAPSALCRELSQHALKRLCLCSFHLYPNRRVRNGQTYTLVGQSSCDHDFGSPRLLGETEPGVQGPEERRPG